MGGFAAAAADPATLLLAFVLPAFLVQGRTPLRAAPVHVPARLLACQLPLLPPAACR
jgi:hypothetical protein